VLTDLEEYQPTQILVGETADTAYLIEMRGGKVTTASLPDGISGQIVSPGLSADGRWLVFGVIQDVDRMSWRMRPCPSPENGCGVIVLYDRETGSFELVSAGKDGSLPNGAVLQPVISADGGKIFYWSSASNLLSVDVEYCSSAGEPPYNCWDLFVYDRLSKSTERVPVGRRYEQLIWNDPISVSADGRFLALTIHHNDRIAKQLDLDEAEVNVYWHDRENGYLQLVNSRDDGVPGDELSILPVISTDGRYVAFSTRSGNLDENDRNGHFDVYLKDALTARVEWVSRDSRYAGMISSSGLASIADLVSGKYSQLGLTNEGRTVLYFSGISYAEDRESDWCLFYGIGFGRCGNIFYRDRQTGEFGPVLEAPEVPGAYITPFISPEGRYVLAVYQYETCPAPYGCAEIWIYDREAGGIKMKLAVPELGKAGKDEQ
jgi:hypothetical protein